MKPVLVCGSVAYDRIMDFDGNFSDHFMKDKLHSINVSFFVSPPKEEFGGTGGNIAYSLSLLGAPSAVMATAGNDFARYDAWMQQHEIERTHLLRNESLPTASGYIMTDKADNQISAFSGSAAMSAHTGTPMYTNYALAIVSPTNKDDMVRVTHDAKQAGLPVLFDPGQQIPVLSAQELRDAITGAYGVIVNDYELALVSEKTGWSEQDIVSRTSFLIVTLGAEGSRLLTQKEEERIQSVATTDVLDPTGAGDAFRAGLIRGILAGMPLTQAAKLGSAVAVYAVECYGTQNHHFTLPELRERYEATYQEQLSL